MKKISCFFRIHKQTPLQYFGFGIILLLNTSACSDGRNRVSEPQTTTDTAPVAGSKKTNTSDQASATLSPQRRQFFEAAVRAEAAKRGWNEIEIDEFVWVDDFWEVRVARKPVVVGGDAYVQLNNNGTVVSFERGR